MLRQRPSIANKAVRLFDRQRQACIVMHKKNRVKKTPSIQGVYKARRYTKNNQHLPTKKERPKEYTKEFSRE